MRRGAKRPHSFEPLTTAARNGRNRGRPLLQHAVWWVAERQRVRARSNGSHLQDLRWPETKLRDHLTIHLAVVERCVRCDGVHHTAGAARASSGSRQKREKKAFLSCGQIKGRTVCLRSGRGRRSVSVCVGGGTMAESATKRKCSAVDVRRQPFNFLVWHRGSARSR